MTMNREDNTKLISKKVSSKRLTAEEKEARKKKKQLDTILEKIETARKQSLELFNPDDYELITTEERLNEYLQKAVENGYLSLDTETTGVDFYKDHVVGICLYVDDEKACYIPCSHVDYKTNLLYPNQLTKEQIVNAFKKIKDVKLIMHNADFDIRMMRHTFGIYLKCWWDTLVGGVILNENEPHGLKVLHGKYVLKQKEYSFSEIFDGINFAYVPINIGYMYAAHDAIITRELQKFQAQFLCENAKRADYRGLYNVFRNIEMRAIDATANMEDTGVYLDIPYKEKIAPIYEKKLEESLKACYKELEPYKEKLLTHEKLSNPVNLSSPSQLAIVLYDIMKIPQKNGRGTGVEVLKSINTPFAKALLDYRGAYKLLNTYINKLPAVMEDDGKIHCRFNAVGTGTGRYSSSDPRLQNCELGSINSVNSGEL